MNSWTFMCTKDNKEKNDQRRHINELHEILPHYQRRQMAIQTL